MRWFWAAYQQGMWREIMDANLPQTAFAEKMLEMMSCCPYDWMVEARGEEGNRPVGLILGQTVGRGIEPFVEWFPWATVRNQMEATAAFLKEVSPKFKLFVFADEPQDKFWASFVRRGMIRRGCKVIDYFSRGEHALMFYTAGT